MNKLKKIGLSALAGSLVTVSAYAGEVTVSGGASMEVDNVNGNSDANDGKAFGMGNQLTFTGGGELENGLNVSISFVLDQGDNETDTTSGAATAPFDSHSITISSDSLGSLKMAGEGGDSAQTAIDTTAAGDLWDNSLGITAPLASDAASGTLFYTSPELTDGLTLTGSYSPNSAANTKTGVGYGLNYTGIEGLSVHIAQAEDNTTDAATADVTTMKASYAYGPITVSASNTEYDAEVATDGQEVTSYQIAYTLSENFSISYGTEKIEDDAANAAFNCQNSESFVAAAKSAFSASILVAESVIPP
jgi:outer membrane protein OmpU